MEIEASRHPKISVVMSVYNGEKYLHEAIESIINQSLDDFEFVIINDASTDASLKIIESFRDPRILLITNETNLGLTKSLNKGLGIAKGEFIARMDADDICYPQRLEKQVAFFETDKDIALCGTWVTILGDTNRRGEYPVTHDEIKFTMLCYNAFAHPTVMWRREVFEGMALKYDENYITAQDYELFSRLVHLVKTANIPEVLLYYREHENQVTKKRQLNQQTNAQIIKLAQLNFLELKPSGSELTAHLCLFDGQFIKNADPVTLRNADIWMNKIVLANRIFHIYSEKLLLDYWRSKLFGSGLGIYNLQKWNVIMGSYCNMNCSISKRLTLKLLIKCLLHWKEKGYKSY